jgi:hypothetical protein
MVVESWYEYPIFWAAYDYGIGHGVSFLGRGIGEKGGLVGYMSSYMISVQQAQPQVYNSMKYKSQLNTRVKLKVTWNS